MSSRRTTQYLINWKFFALSVGLATILVLAAFFLHARQVDQIAGAMLKRADDLELSEKYDDAAQYLFQFVNLQPEHSEGRIRLALTYDHAASTANQKTRAVQFYYQALGVASSSEQPGLRQRLAELLLEVGRFADAKNESQAVLDKLQNDPRAQRTHALATYYSARSETSPTWPSVSAELRKAVQVNPTDVQLAACLANVLRVRLNPQQPEEADRIFDQLVESSGPSAMALLARAEYRQQNNLPGASEDLAAALEKSPQDPAVLMASAADAFRNKRWDSAAELYTSLTKVRPKTREGYWGLGEVYRQQGDAEHALSTWQMGLNAIGHEDFSLGWPTSDLLIEQRRLDEADKQISKLETSVQSQRGRQSRSVIQAMSRATDYLRAKWWLTKGKPFAAIQILDRLAVIPDLQADELQTNVSQIQVQWLRAVALAGVGQWDQAAMAYERVIASQPANPLSRLAAANAWLAAGQYDAAVRHFEIAQSQSQVVAEAFLPYAQALYLQQLRTPAAQRNWTPFERVLANVPREGANAWQRVVLESEYAARIGQPDRAMTLLDQAEHSYSDSDSCLSAVAEVYQKLGKPADADRVLEASEKVSKDSVAGLLARVNLLVIRGQDAEANSLLKSAIASRPEPDRSAVQQRLAQQLLREGKLEEGRKELTDLAARHPDDMQRLQELAELSLDAHDFTDAQKWEQRIRAIEGDEGSLWRYLRVRRLLESSDADATPTLAEAQRLAEELHSRRPSWPETYLLRGLLAERRGNTSDALDAYRQALNLGDRRLSVCERMIGLLYQTQQFDEAWKLLTQLQPADSSNVMSSLAVAVSLRQDDVDRAVGLAKNWVERQPNDFLAYIWLGQAQLLAKQNTVAEQSFRRATELAPHDARPWHALFQYFLQTEQRDAARDALAQLTAHVEMTAAQKAVVLGQGFELLGDVQQAELHYRQAPNDSTARQRLAALLVQKNSPEADEALSQAELSAKTGDERRQIALLLLSRTDRTAWKKALDLATRPDADLQEIPLDNRLQALALMRLGRDGDREKAIQLLTALVGLPRYVQPSDRLMLAGLLEAEGKLQLARDQYQALAVREKPEPTHVAAYADFLIRAGYSHDAGPWVEKLAEIVPGSFVATAAKARWLHSQKRDAEIETLIEPNAKQLSAKLKTEAEQAQFALSVGQLYSSLALENLATSYYRHAFALSPSLYGPLVSSLVAQQQVGEATQICRDAFKAKPIAAPAITLATALSSAAISAADFKLAESFLAEVQRKFPNDVSLLLARSGVRYVQGDLEGVIALSNQVLASDPQNVLALNNLSSLLAEQPANRAKALELIDRALNREGRSPTLLDTKAMVLFHQGQPQIAAQLLQEAVAKPLKDARIRFHCALVYQRLHDLPKARENLSLARSAGLNISSLTPVEKRLLTELEQFVGAVSTPPGSTLSSSETP